MKGSLARSLILLALVYSLAIIAAKEKFFGLTLKSELDPVALGALCVSIFIAFFLQYFFASRAGDLRAEKNLLIEDQKEVLAFAKQCRNILDDCFYAGKIDSQSKQKILSSLRNIANSLEHLDGALRKSQCQELGADFQNIKASYYLFKQTATGGNFPTTPYTATMFVQQDKAYRNLRDHLQSLLFKTNRFQ